MTLAWDDSGKGRKPLIVGIGAQKAGTSWLAQMLGQHPRVWLTPFKEVQYFNHLYIPEHRHWIDWHYRNKPKEIRDRYARRGEPVPDALNRYLNRVSTSKNRYTNPWYRWIFQPAPQHAKPMEVTPEYSQLPEEGVAHVAEWLDETRFLYLIRDPVARAVSQMKMNVSRRRIRPQTLEDWLAEAAVPVLDERGDYAAYIPRWERHAGARLLCLPYGRIARDPLGLLAEVGTFCGIGAWEYDRAERKVFEGPKTISVPDEAVALLRGRLAPQYDFLRQHFGEAFLAETL